MTSNRYPFNDYATYLRQLHGYRIQKITVDVGGTCPNRDGTLGWGGCLYCDNQSFSPTHQGGRPLLEQIEHGIAVSRRRYKNVHHYYVYFQSYSNTYGPLSTLRLQYEEALTHPQVVGLSIGTRPDCFDHSKWDYLEELSKKTDLTLELGIESVFDQTLERVGRGHHFQTTKEALFEAHKRGIKVCGHLIIGFPWENRANWIEMAQVVAQLPLKFLKIHQLRIVKGTPLAHMYQQNPFTLLTMEEYSEILGDFLCYLPSHIVLQRLSSESQGDKSNVLAGQFPLALPEFTTYLAQQMVARGIFQGKLFSIDSL